MQNNVQDYVLWYDQLGMNDVGRVGGKNASLGEMISNLAGVGVSVPNGFATTADAFNEFLEQSGVNDRIYALLDTLDTNDVKALAEAGKQIRQWVIETPFQPALDQAIRDAYQQLSDGNAEVSFAVRSSATAEDMPDASFAGQQETFLNVRGIDAIMEAIKHVFASLFNDRAISYRVHQGYDHRGVALSAGIQRMVRSDIAASGVLFTTKIAKFVAKNKTIRNMLRSSCKTTDTGDIYGDLESTFQFLARYILRLHFYYRFTAQR